MNTVTLESRIARAAGVLEGEGSFFTPKEYCSPTVSCNMTDEDVIEELHSLFGGYVGAYEARYKGSKPYWQWRVHGANAVVAMETVRPYMFSRRTSKIDEVLKVWYDRQEEIRIAEEKRNVPVLAYLDGEGSIRAVAKKYGVSRNGLHKAVQKYRSLS